MGGGGRGSGKNRRAMSELKLGVGIDVASIWGGSTGSMLTRLSQQQLPLTTTMTITMTMTITILAHWPIINRWGASICHQQVQWGHTQWMQQLHCQWWWQCWGGRGMDKDNSRLDSYHWHGPIRGRLWKCRTNSAATTCLGQTAGCWWWRHQRTRWAW
jgi:hypothetical protein